MTRPSPASGFHWRTPDGKLRLAASGKMLLLLCVISMLSPVGEALAEEVRKVHGECSFCHKGEDFKAAKAVINETCWKCHPATEGKDHPVDVVQAISPPDLPLAEGNKITCVTCHEPHGKNTAEKLLRKKFNSLCVQCHNV